MPEINDVLLKIKEISSHTISARSVVSVRELQGELNLTQADMAYYLLYLKRMRFITFMENPVVFVRLTMLGFNANL